MQPSSNPLRTLKGVFEVPKMNHRRDFLRENKLNLRELQKNTTQKLTQQKVEQERQQRKHLQRYQKSQEHFVGRRSNSQQRYNGEDLRQRQPQRAAGGGIGDMNVADGGGEGDGSRPNRMSFRRSYSQHRDSRENLQPTYPAASFDNYGHNNRTDIKDLRVPPRSASAVSIISKAESCDKEIQTEDIIDEDFLYDALKKCSSTEVDFRNKHLREGDHGDPTISRSNVSLHSQHTKYEDNKSTHSRERIQYDYRDHNLPGDNKNFHDQYTERTEYTHMPNGHTEMLRSNQRMQEHEQLGDQFQNLHINPNAARECEAQSSARSRQTMFSNVSKRKANGNYKLGNREEVRLPRYLEKEKREKEEERVREMSRDPHCPLGHYALAEEERLAALNTAQKKMASLIQELNRMPMTTETLRIRSRKVEIEKELTQIELDIRTFSKPKVYVVEEPSSSLQY